MRDIQEHINTSIEDEVVELPQEMTDEQFDNWIKSENKDYEAEQHLIFD